MLVLTRKIGERICIGSGIEIAVVRIHNHRVEIGIQAPREVGIRREEIGDRNPPSLPVTSEELCSVE